LITINYQLWAINVLPSLRYFFKLRAECIHSPVDVEVATQRDVKPVALFAFNDEFIGLSDVAAFECIPDAKYAVRLPRRSCLISAAD